MDTTDATLLAQSRRGHTPAFETLVERYQNLVCAITFSVTGDRGVSEDLAQETFLTAWRSLGDLREPERFAGWLCGIARNLGSKARRRMGRTTELPGDMLDDEDGPEADLAARESEAMVWRALEQIPQTYREPLVLYYREGRSAAQVARDLGLSVSAVEQRLSRGRRHLKRGVEDMVERTLEHSRPPRGFAAAVVAALPVPPGVMPAAPRPTASVPPTPADAGSTEMSAVMKTLIAMSAVVALGAVGYGLSASAQDEDADDRGVGSVAMATADSPAAQASEDLERTSVDESRELRATRERERAAAAARGETRTAAARVEAHAPSYDYELTRMSAHRVAVNLDGGPSTLTAFMPSTETKPTVRTIRGRVLDAEGQPVAGAIVVGGDRLSLTLGDSLATQSGTTSAADGTFALPMTHSEPIKVLALHRDGWSSIEALGAGTEDRKRTLTLAPTAGLEGRITRGGEAFEVDVWISLVDEPGLSLRVATDTDGRFALARLPAGRMQLRTAMPLGSGEASGTPVTRTIDFAPGQTERVDIEVPLGSFLAVEGIRPEGVEVQMMRYTLLPGAHAIEDLETLAQTFDAQPKGEKRRMLYGGVDLDEVMQWNDVPDGPMTVCVEAMRRYREPVALACRSLDAGERNEVVLRPTVK